MLFDWNVVTAEPNLLTQLTHAHEMRRREVVEQIVTEPQIDWKQCSLVEMVPGRLAGAPVLKNTRLPVDAILNNYDDGLEPDQVTEIFEVPVSDVRGILEFREKRVAGSTRP